MWERGGEKRREASWISGSVRREEGKVSTVEISKQLMSPECSRRADSGRLWRESVIALLELVLSHNTYLQCGKVKV